MAENPKMGKGDKAENGKPEVEPKAPSDTREATALPPEEHIAHAKEYHGVPPHVVAGGIEALRNDPSAGAGEAQTFTTEMVQHGIELFRNYKVKFDGEGAQG